MISRPSSDDLGSLHLAGKYKTCDKVWGMPEMTERLKEAMERAGAALLREKQEQLADVLDRLVEDENALAELLQRLDVGDDAKWDAAFAESGDKLDQLAERALEDYRAGRTTLLDPEKL